MLLYGGDTLTFGDIHRASVSLARWLLDQGLQQGDRVLIVLENSPELVISWLGVATAGGVSVPTNPGYTAREIETLVETASPSLAICSVELRHRLPADLPCVCVGDGRTDGRVHASFAEAVSASGRRGLPTVDAEDPASFVFTSGTSGAPKAVVHTHQSYVLTGQAFPSWLGLSDRDVLYTCLPLFHINAQAYSLMTSVCGGTTLALGRRFRARTFWREIRATGATQFNAIGAMLMILLHRQEAPAPGPRVCYSAPAFDPELHRSIEDRFSLKLLSGYALSECPFGTITPLTGDPGLGSIGRPRFDPEMRFVNRLRLIGKDRGEVPAGAPGEIALSNPVIMKEYWADPIATDAALRDGWLYTGDVGRRDGSFLYFVGRETEMLRRRGENVSPVEVEACLQGHPHVAECAVFGVPSKLSEQEIAVAVVPAVKRFDAFELFAWTSERLAPYKIPRFLALVRELPKGPTEKVVREQLAQAWIDGELRTIDREAARRAHPSRSGHETVKRTRRR